MSELGEQIWQRGNVRGIIRRAREDFRRIYPRSRTSAHVGYASVQYSLVKQYKGLMVLKGAWRAFLAVRHARKAVSIGRLSFDQIDVVSTILAKVPWWLGGDLHKAEELIKAALSHDGVNDMVEIPPTTMALMLCTLGFIYEQQGCLEGAQESYKKALLLKEQVLASKDQLGARRQWVRILSAAGLFLFDNYRNEVAVRTEGEALLGEALDLAFEVSVDQYDKIADIMERRDLLQRVPWL